MRGPRLYLVCYDIRHDARLRRVYKVMRGFGDHLQYSVFRCVLSDRQLEVMKARLDDTIHHQQDQVLIVPLGGAESEKSWRMFTLGQPLMQPERVVKVIG